MSNLYSIAGLVVEMSPENRTAIQAEPYRFEGRAKPDIVMLGTGKEYHERHPYLTLEDAQYIDSCREFCYRVLDFDGMMLHASAVVVDGRAYLFSAASGTGKSTHTELWLKKFGDRAYILNDDKPIIRLIDGVWHACGAPWSGKYDISKPACVPLAGIAFLNRDTTNHIERYSGPMALYEILNQTLRNEKKMKQLMDVLDRMVSNVPIWKLFCNMDQAAADVSYNAMSGKEKE